MVSSNRAAERKVAFVIPLLSLCSTHQHHHLSRTLKFLWHHLLMMHTILLPCHTANNKSLLWLFISNLTTGNLECKFHFSITIVMKHNMPSNCMLPTSYSYLRTRETINLYSNIQGKWKRGTVKAVAGLIVALSRGGIHMVRYWLRTWEKFLLLEGRWFHQLLSLSLWAPHAVPREGSCPWVVVWWEGLGAPERGGEEAPFYWKALLPEISHGIQTLTLYFNPISILNLPFYFLFATAEISWRLWEEDQRQMESNSLLRCCSR